MLPIICRLSSTAKITSFDHFKKGVCNGTFGGNIQGVNFRTTNIIGEGAFISGIREQVLQLPWQLINKEAKGACAKGILLCTGKLMLLP